MPVHLLPTTRRALLLTTSLVSVGNSIAAAALLGYQLNFTAGYNKPVPALLAGSIVAALVPLYFLFPLPSSLREKLPRHVKSVMAELIFLGGTAAYMIASVADLHADTPGLLSSCGGFALCRYMTAVLAMSWLIILGLLLSIGTLLSATLYLTYRRHQPVPCHRQAFDEVAWTVYSPKLARGMSVARRLDRQAARKAKHARDGELDRVRRENSGLPEGEAVGAGAGREMKEVRVDFSPTEEKSQPTLI